MTATGENAHDASPIRSLFGDLDFRRFWIAQVIYAGVNGTLRFTFVWLVVTLTDWPSAEGLVAIALGIPATFLSLPAGAWSDRVDRTALYSRWMLAAFVAMGVFTLMISQGWVTPLITGVAAVIVGTLVSVNLPNVQAIVPLLVPADRLMNAVAVQNGGQQAANFTGLALGGVAIALFGDAGGFGLLTVATLASVILMNRVTLPPSAQQTNPAAESMWASIIAGARFALGAEPLRSLLLLALILGTSFSVMQISMPRVVDEVYGEGSSAAGLVLGAFGVGMLVSSVAVARLSSMAHGRNVALFIGIGLGMGQFLLSLAPNIWWAVVVMLGWGVNAGIAMTSHRTLMQTHTPQPMMGRVMGLMMFGFAGSLPIGASISSVLAPLLGPQMTMRAVGLVTIAITIAITWRRAIVDL